MSESRSRRRMSGKERREQLIAVSRALFAEKGFDGTSVEEIAAHAQVSKPVVYEHFGGKEGIYAVVVDREMQRLLTMITEALSASHPLAKLERAALALLHYIEESSEGFRILVRDSHAASGTGTFASLISEIASQVEDMLADEFANRGYDPKLAPMYAQMLVGMVALTGQWWLDVRAPGREEVAANLVNLAWNGLTGLNPSPRLSPAGRRAEAQSAQTAQRAQPPPPVVRPATDKELREREKAREREVKEQEKYAREQEKQRLREQREREKAREKERKEQEKLAREQEKARERELREREKAREREARELEKAREREVREQERLRAREARAAGRTPSRPQQPQLHQPQLHQPQPPQPQPEQPRPAVAAHAPVHIQDEGYGSG
ncbi:TetR/AcrR family transcriptional regulator [Spongiactinospora gelatinilytica]|uniref:TetR/AcrR family transcriptional regulator n=1 Tax=Spongiactinospora gelatinilytica TaxID=2666298 RepID=UPI001F2677E7|nr:TetR family transcriptional regulator [Spongiactinospora gelatinilytica]